jgi:methyl coenzyme M reductase subunit C
MNDPADFEDHLNNTIKEIDSMPQESFTTGGVVKKQT